MRPADRIEAYFAACTSGEAADIAAHFCDDAVIYDTNVEPVRGAERIGAFWVRTRERWQGARWDVDRVVADGEDAAIEWTMTGTSADGRSFAFRGSEHYRFAGGRIAEIRQYWTFDPVRLDTGLLGYPYDERDGPDRSD